MKLSNVLSPLDTCHGEEHVRAIHKTSPVQSARLRIGGPSFRANVRSATLVAGILTALVLVGFLALCSFCGWKSEDYQMSVEVGR